MKNENKCVFVYVPDSLENNNVGFLPGFIQREGSQVKFYITDNKLRDMRAGCIGYCGLADMEGPQERPTYWIRVSFSEGQFQVSHILCDGVQEYKLLYIFYDFESFKKSNVILTSERSRDDFFYLWKCLSNEKGYIKRTSTSDICYNVISWFLTTGCKTCASLKQKIRPLHYSNTFLHIESNLMQAHELFEEVRLTGGPRLRLYTQNVLVSKLLDLLIGLFILHWLLRYREDAGHLASKCTHIVITHIGQLLKLLMGSPVGLKLNNAFNQALGHFFLYHMSLWNTFLLATSPILAWGGTLACWLAAAGFSYQIALAADVFALATFHVYCIYVYAARLYGVQLHGLVALWRLFLGRKRNPLKDRVDTYRYDSHQLFVGTLAFSLLLFLLPTSALYYLVFLMLRLALMLVSTALERLRRLVRNFPVYLTCLWLLNSPRVRGDVYVAVRPTRGALTIHATVRAGSWTSCCRSISPAAAPSQPFRRALLPTLVYGHLI